MKKTLILLFVSLASLLMAAGQKDTTDVEDTKLTIFTSNYPLYFATETLLEGYDGEVELLWLFPEEEDPAFWEPTREDLLVVQKADFLIFNGAEYEKWRNYAFLDESRITDSSKSFKEGYIDTGKGDIHSHGGGLEHSHGGTAFTLWLDLQQYSLQVRAVRDSLSGRIAGADIEHNSQKLDRVLMELDRKFLAVGALFKDEVLLASHPVYQYFARAYLGELRAMLWEPGVFPSEEEWAVLKDMKERNRARFMIWEDEPLPETRERLEEMGLELIIIQPGFSRPGKGNYLDILEDNLRELQRGGGLL